MMTHMAPGKERCEILAGYLIQNRSTVRAVAAEFGISKSTVHKDITQTLRKVNQPMYEMAKLILEANKQERHLRGGEATKNKYKQAKDRKKLVEENATGIV